MAKQKRGTGIGGDAGETEGDNKSGYDVMSDP
jgi:hypothetical protein